jgi:acetoin utilization deacetylase AcuC-like enzyme
MLLPTSRAANCACDLTASATPPWHHPAVDAIPVFYSDEMSTENDPSPSPSADKPRQVVAAWERAGLPIDVRPVVPATPEELSLPHDPAFVRAILACPADNGFGNNRPDVARSLLYTNGAMLCAASLALECGVACAPASGFHHAEYAVAKWFFTFKGLMVASALLAMREEGRRGHGSEQARAAGIPKSLWLRSNLDPRQ